MSCPSVLRRVVPLVAVAVAVGSLGAGSSANAAQPARHTSRELARYLAASRQPVRPPHTKVRPVDGSAAPRHATLVGPRTSGITDPTLTFVDSWWVSATSLNFQILMKDLRTGVVTAATDPTGTECPTAPKLSPDGTVIVYIDYGPNCGQPGWLYSVILSDGSSIGLDGPGYHQLLTDPSWSPDSTSVLYTIEQDDGAGNFVSCGLYTIGAPFGGSRVALPGGGVSGYGGAYSPDGNKIAFTPEDPLSDNWVSVMDADGNNVVKLTTTAFTNYSPLHLAWSPDGTKISYTYVKSQANNVFMHGIGIAKVDDSNAGGLGVTGGSQTNAFYSSWSSDGTEIFYDALLRNTTTGANITGSSLYATDAVGHRRATILTAPNDAYYDSSFAGPVVDTGSASTFTAVAPTRVLPRTTLGPGGIVDVQVAGGGRPAPTGATAVSLNLTGVGPTLATYLQAYPRANFVSTAPPLVSNLNLSKRETAAVAVQVAVDAYGYVRIRNNVGTVGVIVDVSGYFTAGTSASKYAPVTPQRALDTSLGAGATTDVDVASLAAGISGLTPTAVVLNLTAAGTTNATYLSVYPTPNPETAPPTVSNLNLPAHAARANLVTVPIGDAGQVRVFNAVGTTRAIVDVVGFYGTGFAGGLAYYPLQPTRFLDTRNGTGTTFGTTTPPGPGSQLSLQLRGSATTNAGMITLPQTTHAYVFNLTAVWPTASTYLTAFPLAGGVPLASNVNAAAGSVVPGLVITGGDASGLIGIYNKAGSTHMIVDLAGYYAP